MSQNVFRSFRDRVAFLVEEVTYPLWTRIVTPGRTKYLEEFAETQKLSANAIRDLQSARLRTLLLHAYRNVPFYRKLMEDANITPLDIQTPDDLALLPALTSWDLEHHHQDLIARSPGEFRPRSQHYRAVNAALIDRCRQNAGLYPGMRYASMFDQEDTQTGWRWRGALTNLSDEFIHRRNRFKVSSARQDAIKSYLRALRKYHPGHLVGAAHLLAEFAHYCRNNHIDDIQFKGALVEKGQLSGESRHLVESVFRTRVFSRYGCDRVPLIAWECTEHTGLHANEDAMIVQLDPLQGSTPGHGRVLITDLFNFSMPLISLEVGDVAAWCDPLQCPCGCSLRRLAGIEGTVAESTSRGVYDGLSDSSFIANLKDWRDDLTWNRILENKWMN
jgi:phenylacetate-CoA ligase